jgi:hypothetical protein
MGRYLGTLDMEDIEAGDVVLEEGDTFICDLKTPGVGMLAYAYDPGWMAVFGFKRDHRPLRHGSPKACRKAAEAWIAGEGREKVPGNARRRVLWERAPAPSSWRGRLRRLRKWLGRFEAKDGGNHEEA